MDGYNFTKEEAASCRADLRKHNAASLFIAGLVGVCLTLLLAFLPRSGELPRSVYLIVAALEAAACLSAALLTKKSGGQSGGSASSFIFILSLALFCCYVHIADESPLASRFLLITMFLQLIFVLGTAASAVLNIVIAAAFFVADRYPDFLPSAEADSLFGLPCVLFAAPVCFALSRYVSRVIIRGFLVSRSLEKERNRFLDDSIHDQLTGLNNRRSFDQSVGFYTNVCRHVHQTVCVAMMDIDFFKNYNDFYGHTKGDSVLQAVGRVLKETAEEEKLYAARIGGEEFVVLWAENRVLEAERVALKLRERVNALQIPHEKSAAASCVTASFGIYFMRGGSADEPEEMLDAADAAMYKAKEAGRDRIMLLDSADRNCRPVELRPPDELVRG